MPWLLGARRPSYACRMRFCSYKGYKEESMKLHRFAGWALTAALAFLATPAIGSASPSSDAINTVKLAIDAMNKGDMERFVALCDSPAFVIDTFDPYLTGGATGCADWWNARVAYNKRLNSPTQRPASARRGTYSLPEITRT